MFSIELAAKDMGYALAQSLEGSRQLPLTAAVAQVLQRALDSGLGQAHLTAVARVY